MLCNYILWNRCSQTLQTLETSNVPLNWDCIFTKQQNLESVHNYSLFSEQTKHQWNRRKKALKGSKKIETWGPRWPWIGHLNLTNSFREEFWRISLKSTKWKKPPPMAAIFFDGSNIREQFLKRVTQGTILRKYSKFWPALSEKKIF